MNILIVDDDPTNRKLLRVQLENEGHQPREAGDGLEALEILRQQEIDAIVSDVLMPNMDGYRLCTEVRACKSCAQVPFIFYTSTYTDYSDEKLGLELGADFFLRKPVPVAVILKAIQAIADRNLPFAVGQLPDPQDRDVMMQYSQALVRKLEKRNDELTARTAELFASESRFRSIFETEPDGVVVFGRDGVITEINRAGLEIFGTASLEVMDERRITHLIVLEHWEAFQVAIKTSWMGGTGCVEFQVASRGTRRWIEMHAAPLCNGEGTTTALLGILRDNTARRELQAQFVQAQKMEVVGQLASGVAHDFNNMLGIVMGYAEMAKNDLSSGTLLYEQIETILHTAERAAALTRQLLIFSRKQTLQPQVLDLSEIIMGIDPMLRRLIGENVNLVTVPESELRRVEADAGQIEQILMNLTVNAKDAMPNGGTLILSTSNVTVLEDSLPCPEMRPGDYVKLSVSDEGTGMTDEVKAKMFDPFFTTKDAGKGTGLGLATCHSIATQWNGYIAVESVLGHGTTFHVYLPQAINGRYLTAAAIDSPGATPRGEELILVVEDELGLRELAVRILSKQGYSVLKAANGQEALRMVREPRDRQIDLVVTDMVMPEMGGKMMAEWLQATNPEIKVLFTSGCRATQHRHHIYPVGYLGYVAARQERKQPPKQQKEGRTGRVGHLQLVGTGNELAAVPEAGRPLDREGVGNEGYGKNGPTRYGIQAFVSKHVV